MARNGYLAEVEELSGTSIQAACGQFQPVFGDTRANINKIGKMTREARADLIVFPELATSGYEFHERAEAETHAIDFDRSEYVAELVNLASDTGSHIVIGLPERAGNRIFNSSLLIEPTGRWTHYRKLHLFDREKLLFDPGEAPAPVIETKIGRIGLMICFDWIFPEVARSLALNGAQVICHPSNLVLTFCQRAMFARSVENGVFTMTCNRIGSETRTGRTLNFTGASQVLSNKGETLAQAGSNSEEIIRVELDPTQADNKMITALNDRLGDRRPEYYSNLN